MSSSEEVYFCLMKFFRVAGGNVFTSVRQIKELVSAQFHWELKFPGVEKQTKGEVGISSK